MKSMSRGLVLTLLLAMPAESTEPAATTADVLRGLDRVYVQVDYVSEILADGGIREADLLVELANGLRESGLLVLSADPEQPGSPLAALAIESVELPTGHVVLHGSLDLREVVTLAREPTVTAFGSVWYTSVLEYSLVPELRDNSHAVVAALAATLVADLTAGRP